MDLLGRIRADLKEAMKAKDERTLSALRMLSSAVHNREIEKREPLTETEVMEVVMREAKKRTESRDLYRNAGRTDLAEAEMADLAVLARYLPEPATPAEIEAAVDAAIAAFPNVTPADAGKIMGVAMKPLKGRAQPADVSAFIKQKLG